MSVSGKEFGKEGEDIAVELLRKKGFEIIKRNFHFGASPFRFSFRDRSFKIKSK